jgi:hypothetical protein
MTSSYFFVVIKTDSNNPTCQRKTTDAFRRFSDVINYNIKLLQKGHKKTMLNNEIFSSSNPMTQNMKQQTFDAKIHHAKKNRKSFAIPK